MIRVALPVFALLLTSACLGKAENDTPAPNATASASTTPPSAVAATTPEIAAANGKVSRYTSLKDCTAIDGNEDEDWSVSRCKGLGQWTLQLDYGDAREDLRLLSADEGEFKLDLIGLGSGGFNAIGETVEWRGSGEGANFKPTALIVRNTISEDPAQSQRQTALLYVIDLAQHCAIARVRPGPRQNEEARASADGSARACLE